MRRKEDYSYKITEKLGSYTDPGDKTEWCKAILKLMLGECTDFEPNKDSIPDEIQMRLDSEQLNEMIDRLLENGYGSTSAITNAYNKRRNKRKKEDSKS